MGNIIILLAMIQCHIIDDYYLQGILAKMKQKKFWQENAPQKLYKSDYVCALITHAFSWTFSIMLPIMVVWHYGNISLKWWGFIGVFALNWIIHAIVDNAKANKLKINLIIDQLIHMFQIVVTWLIFVEVCE